MIVGVKFIFDKTGRRGDDLIAGIQDGLQGNVQCTRCTAGHQNFFIGDRCLLFFGQIIRHRSANHRVTGIGHIAVISEAAGIDGVSEQLVELFRRWQVGIAQAKVIDVFRPVFGLQLSPFLKHLADKGRPGNDILNFFGYGHFLKPRVTVKSCGLEVGPALLKEPVLRTAQPATVSSDLRTPAIYNR